MRSMPRHGTAGGRLGMRVAGSRLYPRSGLMLFEEGLPEGLREVLLRTRFSVRYT